MWHGNCSAGAKTEPGRNLFCILQLGAMPAPAVSSAWGGRVNIVLQNAIRVLGSFIAALLFGLTVSPTLAAGSEQHLVLGRISSEPRKHVERLQAMADYLADRLSSQGVAGIGVLVVETSDRMRALLREGRVDILSETAFVALDLIEDGAARPLMREWKSGVPEYRSVIVARKDSGVTDLASLVGRKFAFEDPGSTSGYLMPRDALEQAGLPLAQLADPRAAPPDGTVGYSFANGEINVVAWVNRGLADAGAISNLDWADPNTAPARLRNGLIVIHETQPVIRSLILVRKSLDDRLANGIAAILETMHESPEGRAALKKYARVARYDRLEGEALTGLEVARAIRQRTSMRAD